MTDENRISGVVFVKWDGNQIDVIGDWSYRINPVKRTTELGSDKVHGYKELPQENFIEGEARDNKNLDLAVFQGITNATVTAKLANGKTIVLRNAWYASEGEVGTESANIKTRFEGMSGEEV